MLIGVHADVTPPLLTALARMRHGDEIVVADANFPSASTARHCVIPDVIYYPGFDAPRVIELITGLMPLDGFHDYSALHMEVDGAGSAPADVHKAAFDIMTPRLPEGGSLSSIERQDFYVQAKTAFAVVHTSESRPFGCFILRKGVIF